MGRNSGGEGGGSSATRVAGRQKSLSMDNSRAEFFYESNLSKVERSLESNVDYWISANPNQAITRIEQAIQKAERYDEKYVDKLLRQAERSGLSIEHANNTNIRSELIRQYNSEAYRNNMDMLKAKLKKARSLAK